MESPEFIKDAPQENNTVTDTTPMAQPRLQECPDCGKLISRSAVQCPNCGHPFVAANTAQDVDITRQQIRIHEVQTTEKTSKEWKAAMAGGCLLTLIGFGCMFVSPQLGLGAIVLGVIIWLVGHVCAWWCNG